MRADRTKIIERARVTFKRAILHKPAESERTGIEQTFAPLIVEETQDGAESTAGPKTLKVYFAVQTASIGGEEHDQVVYLWAFAGGPSSRPQICDRFSGVRITIAHDGYPLIWEAITGHSGPRLIFAAESLEQEAREAFGNPPSGARLALEKQADAAGAVVVATVEQGPVAMGPYIYVSASPERWITTILCRCSPSQVEEFAATAKYELHPIEAIESQCPNLRNKLGPTGLEDVLRWPRKKP